MVELLVGGVELADQDVGALAVAEHAAVMELSMRECPADDVVALLAFVACQHVGTEAGCPAAACLVVVAGL